MTDDIRALTARLAEEPGSLAFLELAEALRRRGQLEAAYKVARGGLTRYPGLADAHDLMARVLSDQGDLAGAFDAWASALQLDPMRTSALKGVAFLYFRAGEPAAALEHLERAMEVDPDDPSIRQAIARVGPEVRRSSRGAAPSPREPQPEPRDREPVERRPHSPRTRETPARESRTQEPGAREPWARGTASPAPGTEPAARPSVSGPSVSGPSVSGPSVSGPFDDVDGGAPGLLLVDANGLRLAGRMAADEGGAAGDRVAAQLAGVSREAARATRLLGLGTWHAIAIESRDGHVVLTQATADTVVLAARDSSLPAGRVAMLAERAARSARAWLEAQG